MWFDLFILRVIQELPIYILIWGWVIFCNSIWGEIALMKDNLIFYLKFQTQVFHRLIFHLSLVYSWGPVLYSFSFAFRSPKIRYIDEIAHVEIQQRTGLLRHRVPWPVFTSVTSVRESSGLHHLSFESQDLASVCSHWVTSAIRSLRSLTQLKPKNPKPKRLHG